MEEWPSIVGDDLGVDITGKEQGSAGVPKIVKAGIGGQTGALEESGERAVAKFGGADSPAGLVGEDEAASLVERAQALHLPHLALQVVPESVHHARGKFVRLPLLVALLVGVPLVSLHIPALSLRAPRHHLLSYTHGRLHVFPLLQVAWVGKLGFLDLTFLPGHIQHTNSDSPLERLPVRVALLWLAWQDPLQPGDSVV